MARILPFRRRVEGGGNSRVPSDARAEDLFPSDARPMDEPIPGREPDPEFERRRSRRRRAILFVLVFVFVLGSAAAAFGSRGWLELRRARSELATLEAEVEAKHERVLELRREVDRLRRDPATIARIAREDLGYAEEGEITILLPPEDRRGPSARLWLPPLAPKRARGVEESPRD